MPKPERARYSNYVKDQVRKRYHLCRTTEDKQALADELGIGSVPKLYNLASRLGATSHDPTQDIGEFAAGTEAHEEERLLIREDPSTTVFNAEADRYLRAEFGRRTMEAIAYHLHHSETAVAYRARQLGLRKPVKHWNVVKVAAWLGTTVEELKRDLVPAGVDVYPLGDRRQRVILEVVSTTSLARWLADKNNLKSVRARGADEFFLMEITESVDDLVNGKTSWELCKFLSHGHVCQNPYTENSFGLYCTKTEKNEAGFDRACGVRTLAIEDLRPEWM